MFDPDQIDLDQMLRNSVMPHWADIMPKPLKKVLALEMRRPELLELLRKMDAESGGRVTLFEYCRAAKVSAATLQRKFGGWRAFRVEAGLSPVTKLEGRGSVHSREALVAKLRELLSAGEPRLTEREFCRRAGVSTSTIERLCVSWRQLRAEAAVAEWRPTEAASVEAGATTAACENVSLESGRAAEPAVELPRTDVASDATQRTTAPPHETTAPPSAPRRRRACTPGLSTLRQG